MIDIQPASLIFTIINVLVFVWIMKKLLFKRVMDVIDKRDNLIKSRFDEAESEKTKALSRQQEYEKKLAAANDEAKAIVAKAREQAAAERERTLEETRVENEHLIEKNKEAIRSQNEEAKAQLRNDIAKLAMTAARKILTEDQDKQSA